ncbi:hypothetical protein FGE12_12240 [Aggregicoccus sp. 17bor-14]|uniref:hypothetical protein n=1 Tax=Myxococcaceae TaxID=31 RepID=UPI00129CDED0|nr:MULTISPECIES: hypothetical protein [Myxococcaceae]MBF5043159.1 hypothetical protein [Simulacricoccus sp. 17bor-14]MRI88918.1 hypothetical protein [Aggregicoccus sp. 17bor-14]
MAASPEFTFNDLWQHMGLFARLLVGSCGLLVLVLGVTSPTRTDIQGATERVPPETLEAAAKLVRWPALGLVGSAALSLLVGSQYLHRVLLFLSTGVPPRAGQLDGSLLHLAMGLVTLAGAVALLRLHFRAVVVAGATCAAIPCFGAGFGVGFLFALWAVLVLGRPEVQAAFALRR